MHLVEKVDKLSHLISPRRDINLPIYNWHAFKHSYSKELVDTILQEFQLKKGAWVLDSFCGGGTTLLACKDAGINAEGYDIMPFSVFLSSTKTSDFDIQDILNVQSGLSKLNFLKVQKPYVLIDIPLLDKAFPKEHISIINNIKKSILEIADDSTRNFFKLALLSILESASNTQKAGGFLRIVDKRVTAENIVELFFARVSQMIADLQNSKLGKVSTAKIKTGLCDARAIKTKRKFDAVITSPPYPNRHDYTRIYSLELIFGDIESNDELKTLRYNTLRSHVEAKKVFELHSKYKVPTVLHQLISQVKDNGVNNIQVINMLYGYFEDMHLSMLRMKNCLKPNGKVAIVVSNVRFSGVNIPVDEILGGLAEAMGFKDVSIIVARYRGNSAQQMKQYDRVPSRESIVTFVK